MKQKTLSYSLYTAVIVIILALTGIFGSFASRDVIRDRITLDVVTLIIMLGIAPMLVGLTVRDHSRVLTLLNTGVSGLIVAGSIALVILFEAVVPREELIFVFRNYEPMIGTRITFGFDESNLLAGIMLLLLSGAGIGLLSGVLVRVSPRLRTTVLGSLAIVTILGLLEGQIRSILTLPDAVAVILAFAAGYIAAVRLPIQPLRARLTAGLASGALVGAVLALLVSSGVLAEGNAFGIDLPGTFILGIYEAPFLPFIIIFGILGAVGGLLTFANTLVHNIGVYGAMLLFLLGLLNSQGRMTDLVAIVSLLAFALAFALSPELAQRAAAHFQAAPDTQKRSINRLSGLAGIAFLIVLPIFAGQYITNVMDTVMLFIIMGIGLNVMVGFAGLLDLGYVASFAIGAYTLALLTTPSIITTGCVPLETVETYRYIEMCTGVAQNWGGIGLLTFWQAWPMSVIVSALTGMALGVPVLGLRGDYLAIVTLGFGEITRVLTRANVTKPLLGSAQGISPIPVPVIDLTAINPAWYIELNNASSIYYLYLFSVLLAGFVVLRLASARLGRAWRAIRTDEDVAEAMGVHLVRTKLLAFGISSAFAGLGGAIFAAQLRGIFPDSFTLLVSINVLSLILIGGLGSIPGVIVGALMLVGLPEALRELQDYRLLAFGTLLVVTMLLKPKGLIPPEVPQLAQRIRGKDKRTDDAPHMPSMTGSQT